MADPTLTSRALLKRLQLYLFLAGIVAGILQLSHPVGFGQGFEMYGEATSLATHGTFADPFYVEPTGVTAVSPPLYPIILAMFIKVLGAANLVALAALAGNIVANAITAALLPRLSVFFYESAIPGAVAAVFWLGGVRLMPAWDSAWTAAGLVVFCLVTARVANHTNPLRSGALAGIVGGLLSLTNASSLLLTIPWVVYVWIRRRQTSHYCIALLGVFFLISAAWGIRNFVRLGSFRLRTAGGMTQHVSNMDCAESSLYKELQSGCFDENHPNKSLREAELVRVLGEVEYDRRCADEAKRWAIANPSRFLNLTLVRIREFWFPPREEHPFRAYAIWLGTLLAIPGLFLMAQRREPAVVPLTGVFLLYPLMYYLVISDVRYRYPMLWLSLLPAGYAVAEACRFLVRKRMA